MKKAPNTSQAAGALVEQLSFLDPVPLSPTLPTLGTLPDELLGVLLAGERMEQPEWLTLTRSWRLAATVGQLKDIGWPVQSLPIPAPSKRNPRRTIARYFLTQDAIAAGLALVRRGQA